MSTVSVKDVDELAAFRSELDATKDAFIAAGESLNDKYQNSMDENSVRISDASGILEACKEEVEAAQQQVESATSAVSAAQSALSSCQATPSHDSEGNEIMPDCSGEEQELSDREQELNKAEEQLQKSQEKMETAQRNLEILQEIQAQLQQLSEEMAAALNGLSVQFEELCREGSGRITGAVAVLRGYFESGMASKSISGRCPDLNLLSWLYWTPESGKPATPDTLNQRLSLTPEMQLEFGKYLLDHRPAFREQSDRLGEKLKNAAGIAEVANIQRLTRSNLAGTYAEQLAIHALAPFTSNISVQKTTNLENGTYTKTDLFMEGLKVPVILGRGQRMGASPGENIAIEVKCGKAAYLLSQLDHMEFQARGHANAQASATICSRDIKDLSPKDEAMLRDRMKNAGSSMIGMLPLKNEIDILCWDIVSKKAPIKNNA